MRLTVIFNFTWRFADGRNILKQKGDDFQQPQFARMTTVWTRSMQIKYYLMVAKLERDVK